jgi:hypothetical protein
MVGDDAPSLAQFDPTERLRCFGKHEWFHIKMSQYPAPLATEVYVECESVRYSSRGQKNVTGADAMNPTSRNRDVGCPVSTTVFKDSLRRVIRISVTNLLKSFTYYLLSFSTLSPASLQCHDTPRNLTHSSLEILVVPQTRKAEPPENRGYGGGLQGHCENAGPCHGPVTFASWLVC